MKPVEWLGDSLKRLRAFPHDVMREAGHELGRMQSGREPKHWKPMPSIGAGVNELRIRMGSAYRVIYVMKFDDAIYVLHAFQKKSQRTARLDIELARIRFRTLMNERARR